MAGDGIGKDNYTTFCLIGYNALNMITINVFHLPQSLLRTVEQLLLTEKLVFFLSTSLGSRLILAKTLREL